MNILNLTSLDTGGAGMAAIRQHKALTEAGENSRLLLLLKKKAGIDESHQFNDYKNPGPVGNALHFMKVAFHPGINKIKMLGRKGEFEIFSPPYSMFDITTHPLFKEADVVNLHWVPYFLDWRTFFRRADRPVVWTFHDMNPFTGGCHVAFGCEKYMQDCADCPQLTGTPDRNYSKKNLRVKLNGIAPAENLAVATPSKWLGETSMSSPMFGRFPHRVINNGLDSEVFRKQDQTQSRKELGIPQDKKVLLFVSDKIGRWYKGFRIILRTFGMLEKRPDILLVSLGEPSGEANGAGRDILELGFVSGEEKISKVYSAADAFVTPSLADNFPNTVLESLICGTPVVGFPIGGIREMVDHGENGFLCDDTSAESLAKTIEIFLDNINIFDKDKIRQKSIEKWDHMVMARKYIDLYKELINKKSGSK
jgi:glycosyltransferase involved in cell wall biosynthesis